MKRMLTFILTVVVILFTACGGGGSGTSASSNSSNSLSYTGKTEVANLDEVVVKEFIQSLDLVSSNNTLDVSDDTIQKVSKDVTEKTSKLLEKVNQKVNGSISGSVDFTRKKINSLTTEINAVFQNYNDGDGTTIDGKVKYLITVDDVTSTQIRSMDMTFDLLDIKDSENDITMDGTVNVVINSTGTRQTYTQNIIAKNNADSKMIRFEDFVTVYDENDRELSYSGKIYDSEMGYVVVSTAIELSYNDMGELNVGAEIHYKGKDSTIIEKSAYDNTIRIEVDEGSNGTVDKVEVYDKSTFTIIPNREPVISIVFPQSIYTDTNMSEMNVTIYDPDLDAFTSEYEWKVDDIVKSSSVTISNDLFKKHETLKLTIMATDDREDDIKIGTQSKEQGVLNSTPIVSISSNAIGNSVEALAEIEFDTSKTVDKDNDPLTYIWEVYKYIHESESGEAVGELIHEDTPSLAEHFLFKVDASDYFNNLSIAIPTYKAISEGVHVIKCIVSDDDLATDEDKLALTTATLDILEDETLSKVLFQDQDSLYEWTQSTVEAYDLNNDAKKELIFLTNNPTDYSGNTLLHITSNLKGTSSTSTYEVKINDSDKIEFIDFNGNNRLDIILIGQNNRYVMVQNEDGTFESPIEIELNRDVIYLNDFNNDGISDTAQLIDCTLNIFTDFNDSTKVIQHKINYCQEVEETHTLNVGDFNNDEVDDFIVLIKNHVLGELYFIFLYQDENNSFVESKVHAVNEPVYEEIINIGDINGDGFNDVVIDFVLFENQKDFNFQEVKTLDTHKNGSTNFEVVIMDMNNDKKEEIFYENSGDLRVFLQGEDFTMSEFKVKSIIESRVVTDIDNDGKLEIIENYANKIDITSLN